jgi:hypothetical protein
MARPWRPGANRIVFGPGVLFAAIIAERSDMPLGPGAARSFAMLLVSPASSSRSFVTVITAASAARTADVRGMNANETEIAAATRRLDATATGLRDALTPSAPPDTRSTLIIAQRVKAEGPGADGQTLDLFETTSGGIC